MIRLPSTFNDVISCDEVGVKVFCGQIDQSVRWTKIPIRLLFMDDECFSLGDMKEEKQFIKSAFSLMDISVFKLFVDTGTRFGIKC